MSQTLPVDRIAGTDAGAFEERVSSYAQRLRILLSENPWAFWKKRFWTYGHWARRDSELQKILARSYGLLHEVLRWHSLREGSGNSAAGHGDTKGMDHADQKRIEHVLEDDPTTLTLDAALEFFDALDRIMIEIGDARYVCGEIEGEFQWGKGSTTWLTWEAMYGRSIPEAVETYRSGKTVLVRGSDLRAFRAGLIAQVLLGAASSLVLLLLLASGILEIAGTGSPEGKAALGFVAGFSEPFFLKTIQRVAKMGEESEEGDKPAKHGESRRRGAGN